MLRRESGEAGRLSPSAVAWRFERLGVSPIKCLLYNHFADTGCLYSMSQDRNTSSAFEVSAAAPPTLLVKAVTSIAEKLLEKVLTYFFGFR